jgi:hypothetical protein
MNNLVFSFDLFFEYIYIFLAIVFVYDYIPCSETLQKRHFNSNNSLLKGWANPYNISGEDRPFSAGKGIRRKKNIEL